MKVLHLSGQRFRKFNREGFTRLWKQGLLDVTVRNPHNFSVVVVETDDDVGNVYGLAALVHQLSVEYGVSLGIRIELLIHDPNHWIRRRWYERGFHIHSHVLNLAYVDVWT